MLHIINHRIYRTYMTYAKRRRAFACPQMPRAISALCTEEELTVAASGSSAHVYRRAELVYVCEGEHPAPVRQLC